MSAQNESDGPKIFFGIEVTRRCNLQCPHCFTSSGGRSHPGPTLDELKVMFRQLVAVGVRHVAFSGGEPLVRKDLEQIMEAGREQGLQNFSMVTNGIAAEPQRMRRLRKAGLAAVQVSIDGVDSRDHCRIRGCEPRAFYRALAGIRAFREANITVDIATILAGRNISRAPEMVMMSYALGARKLRYCSFVATGRASDEHIRARYAFDSKSVDGFFDFMRSVRKKKDRPVDMVIDHGVGPWVQNGTFRCVAGRHVAYITGEGDLYPCPSLLFEPFKVGNILHDDLKELLNSKRMHQVRLMTRTQVDEPCRSCSNERCSGGCRGSAFAATGRVDAAPNYCNFLNRRTCSAEP